MARPGAEEPAERHEEGAEDLWAFIFKLPRQAEKLLSQGEKEASKGVHDATDAAREGAVQVVKGLSKW